jgi:hypothetical protein
MDLAIQVAVAADQEAHLRSLRDWLLADDELALHHGVLARLEPAAPPAGQMGAVSEVLTVSLSAGGAGAMLARSLEVWLQTRTTDLKLKITGSAGVVELDAKRVRDSPALIEQLRAIAEPPDRDAP